MTRPALDKLLSPRSIAIVGASERPEAIGTRVIRNLRLMEFPGAIYPVNPRYPMLGDLIPTARNIDARAATPVMPAPAGIHDSYEVSPVKWKFAHLATFPSVFSCCD
jgi:acetyltransferase